MQHSLKQTAKFLIPFIALSSCVCHKCGEKIINKKSEPFINICKEFKSDVEFARNYKYTEKHPLTPSDNVTKKFDNLEFLVKSSSGELSLNDNKKLLNIIKKHNCDKTLKDFYMLAEEQDENKSVDDIIKYYNDNNVRSLENKDINSKLRGLINVIQITQGYQFLYVKNYFALISNELEMLNNLEKYSKNDVKIENFTGQLPNLKNKYVTFVGAGFPLSGISINILTGAKINLIEIDKVQLRKAKAFLNIIAKAGIINIKDFSFTHADGQEMSYSKGKIKTDILHLASALPNSVKKEIFKNIAREKANQIIIIDRYVSGIFKLLYDNKVYSKEVLDFKTIAKIYPENLYHYKKDSNKDIVVKPTSIMNVNSSRLLILN